MRQTDNRQIRDGAKLLMEAKKTAYPALWRVRLVFACFFYLLGVLLGLFWFPVILLRHWRVMVAAQKLSRADTKNGWRRLAIVALAAILWVLIIWWWFFHR